MPENTGFSASELNRAAFLLAAIVDSSDDAIISKDLNGVITSWNRSAQTLFGYTAQEAIGKTVAELLIPEDRKAEEPELLARLRRGERVEHFETVRRRKDGTLLDISLAISPVKDATGSVIGASKIARDISYRKLEDRSTLLLSAIVDSSDDAIISKDLNGVITSWNRSAQRLFGYTAEEASGKTVAELLIPDDRQAEEPQILARLRRGERVEHFETVRRRKDGTLLDISLAISPVKDAAGTIIGASKIARDIGDRKKMEAELRRLNETLESSVRERTRQLSEANQELEAFAYSVSHDLRAPLRSVDGFGRILVRDYAGKVLDERGKHCVERMSAATLRMGQLIEDLLNLSRVGRTSLTRQTIDVGSLAKNVWADIVSQDPDRTVSFEVEPNLHACADAALLRIALQNLLGNAWKFTGNHTSPEVFLGSAEIDGRQTFFVRDNGVGFDMAHADHLFAAFQRLHSGREFEGSGIGLAIVQRILHRHGGQIWVKSALLKGATFFFTLPGENQC